MIIRPTMSMPVLVDYRELNPLSTWVIPTNGCQEGPKNLKKNEEKFEILIGLGWKAFFSHPTKQHQTCFICLVGLTR